MRTQDALFIGLHSKSSEPIFHAQTIIFESTGEKVMKQAHNPRCYFIFIGPESDHWLCLSVTPSLPNSLTP